MGLPGTGVPQPQPAGEAQAYPPQPTAGRQAYPPQPQPTADGPWQLFPAQPPYPPPAYIDQPAPHQPVENVQLAARRPRFTWSPLGLVVGLLGVVVQALFTYLVTFEPTAHWQPALDANRTAILLNNLDKMSASRPWELPLVLIVPFLPVLQMLVVIVLSIPRARTVSPQLVSRGRIGWVLFFGLLTVYAATITVVLGPAGAPQLLFYWLGCLVVVVAIALPHRPD